jgi:hypothetical protein
LSRNFHSFFAFFARKFLLDLFRSVFRVFRIFRLKVLEAYQLTDWEQNLDLLSTEVRRRPKLKNFLAKRQYRRKGKFFAETENFDVGFGQ